MSHTSETLLIHAWQARRRASAGDARRCFIEAIELCLTPAAEMRWRRHSWALESRKRNLGSRNLARQSYEEAIAIYRAAGDALEVAHAVRHLGDICYEEGRPDLADPHFQEALALYRADPRTGQLDLANAIRSLAVLKDEHGDPEEAARLWQEAGSLYEAVNVADSVTESSARLAEPRSVAAGEN